MLNVTWQINDQIKQCTPQPNVEADETLQRFYFVGIISITSALGGQKNSIFYPKLCLGGERVVEGSQPRQSAMLSHQWFPIQHWTCAVGWEQLGHVALRTAAASCHKVVVAHVSLTPQQVKSAWVMKKPAVTDLTHLKQTFYFGISSETQSMTLMPFALLML